MKRRTVMVCRHVAMENVRTTIAMRARPESKNDSGWQCMCDQRHPAPTDAVVVSMKRALELCPELAEIKDMPCPCMFTLDPDATKFRRSLFETGRTRRLSYRQTLQFCNILVR